MPRKPKTTSNGQERVYLFIDGSNLYKGVEAIAGSGRLPPPEMRQLCETLCGPDRRLVKIFYYNSPLHRNDPGYKGQQKFFDGLKKISFLELRLGRLAKRTTKVWCPTCAVMFEEVICPKCRNQFQPVSYRDKGTDVRIATDLLTHAFDNQYDTAILVSEDADFVSAVQEVRRLRKKVENAYTRKGYLADNCNRFIFIDKMLIDSVRSRVSSPSISS